jgi:hypothetical protein
MVRSPRAFTALAVVGLVVILPLLAGGCRGRTPPAASLDGGPDAGNNGSIDAGANTGTDAGTDAGTDDGDAKDAGTGDTVDGGGNEDGGAPSEGEGDAGPVDAGNGFDLGGLLDGGLADGLSCLPDSLPALSVSGAFDALDLSRYSGRSEPGVQCGDVTCDEGVPCCVLCGYGACAGQDDTGAARCPGFTATYACDGNEECARDEVCCFTLSGTSCRAAADCAFDVGGALSQFIVDGGLALPEPPAPADAGFLDGGFTPVVAVDGGFADGGVLVVPGDDGGVVDAGFVPGPPLDGGFVGGDPIDGGPAPGPDAGSLLDGLQETLSQGVPVCTSTIFGCDVLSFELCCTSERLTAVDLGFCLPAALCVGSILP